MSFDSLICFLWCKYTVSEKSVHIICLLEPTARCKASNA
jgi:hypothetical protein